MKNKIQSNPNQLIRVLPVHEENKSPAQWLVELFQLKGYHADLDARPILVGKRINQARQDNAQYVVLVDEAYNSYGIIKIKDLNAGQEYLSGALNWLHHS